VEAVFFKTLQKWPEYLMETNYFEHGLTDVSVLIFLKYSKISDLDIFDSFKLNLSRC
jgi:hypothetical protein